MRMTVRTVAGIAALLMVMGQPGRTDPQYDVAPIVGVDLIQKPLTLEAAWATGVLRTTISGPGDPATWSVRLDYGNGRILELDGAALASRVVRQGPESLTVDLPILGGASVSASSQVTGLRVRPTNVISLSTIRPQQLIEGSPSVRALDDSASAQEKAYAMAFGRLDVTDGQNRPLGVCTAFRVAKTYWLTAAHCVYRSAAEGDASIMAHWWLQPDAYAGRPEGARRYEAVLAASGLADDATTASYMKAENPDYALLQVAADPGGPVLPLNASPMPRADTRLELLQHWMGEITPPPPGKAVASCVVREHLETDDYSNSANCPFTLQHTCSSLGGASGGALVDAANFRLVGLHYGAGKDGKFNCATPVATISQDICHRFSKIAGKVLSCTAYVPPKP